MVTEKEASQEGLGLWIHSIAAPVGLLTIVGGPIVLCWQIFLWLRSGRWTEIQIGWLPWKLGLDPTNLTWLGVRKMVIAVYDLPMWFGLIILGGLVAVSGMLLGMWIDGEKF